MDAKPIGLGARAARPLEFAALRFGPGALTRQIDEDGTLNTEPL
jgi:hypothetical protein